MTRFETILFDLDGTLIDSAPGITHTIAYTLKKLGKDVPPLKELLHWVGPPLPESFKVRAGLDEAAIPEAIEIYREHYLSVGAYDAKLFDGVGELLRDLRDDGRHLAIATSKPTTPATLMIEHFTLAPYFDVIAAAADDESRGAKHLIIDDAVNGLRDVGLGVNDMVMVGDRIHDIEGAAAHAIPSAVVHWGYGTPQEWESATYQIDTPRQLRSVLGLPAPRA